MLISYKITEGAQLRTGSLKRSFVVQNKLHGLQNNARGTAKCVSKKRGDITTERKKQTERVVLGLENNQRSC